VGRRGGRRCGESEGIGAELESSKTVRDLAKTKRLQRGRPPRDRIKEESLERGKEEMECFRTHKLEKGIGSGEKKKGKANTD